MMQTPKLEGSTHWVNSQPLTLAALRGKVVLIDFWTYSCINCIRTLPYLTAWYEKYVDSGLVIIGVHSPEFEFEKDTEAKIQELLGEKQALVDSGEFEHQTRTLEDEVYFLAGDWQQAPEYIEGQTGFILWLI